MSENEFIASLLTDVLIFGGIGFGIYLIIKNRRSKSKLRV